MRYLKHVFITVVLFACGACFCHSQEIKKVKIGELKTLIDTTNHPLIINFWASWCQPCVHEIPWFEENVKPLKGKVELILVSLDFIEDYPTHIADFAKEHGFTSRIIFLNETNADIFCPLIDSTWDGAVPATLFVDKQRNYRRFYTEQITEPKFKMALNDMMNNN